MASSLPHYASKDVLYEEERDFISSGTFSQVFRGQLRNRPSSDSFAVIAVKVSCLEAYIARAISYSVDVGPVGSPIRDSAPRLHKSIHVVYSLL